MPSNPLTLTRTTRYFEHCALKSSALSCARYSLIRVPLHSSSKPSTQSQVAPESAHVAAVIVVLLANVLGGYNPRLDELQAMGLGWLGQLSYARWLLEALFINELQVRPRSTLT